MENKSLMVFNVTVDLSNKAQVEALNEFTKKMSETYSGGEEAPEQKPVETSTEQKPATRTRSRKSNPIPAPAEEKTETDTDSENKKVLAGGCSEQGTELGQVQEPEPEKEAPKVESIKVEDVRALLAEKVDDHRMEIKKKLTELGAPNVSALDPEKYVEFMEFLKSL